MEPCSGRRAEVRLVVWNIACGMVPGFYSMNLGFSCLQRILILSLMLWLHSNGDLKRRRLKFLFTLSFHVNKIIMKFSIEEALDLKAFQIIGFKDFFLDKQFKRRLLWMTHNSILSI